jgi:hypothetical protein
MPVEKTTERVPHGFVSIERSEQKGYRTKKEIKLRSTLTVNMEHQEMGA